MNKKHHLIICRFFLALAFSSGVATRAESIVQTVHNLSVSGPGTNRATAEMDVCIFCHTSHKTQGVTPLWNHNSSSVTNYVVFSSPTLENIGMTIPQPNGASRLCLSCHDGTVALGSISSQTTNLAMMNNITTLKGSANLGTDLSGDHPISFVYNRDLAGKIQGLADPLTLNGKIRLDGSGRLQCTACHDPHNNQFGKFLVEDNTGSAICVTCHTDPTWSSSAHAMSAAPAPQIATSAMVKSAVQVKMQPKKTTVAAMGCASCHSNHRAGSKKRLMKFSEPEDNCFSCHDGNVSKKNIVADMRKSSGHAGGFNAKAHDLTEDVINPKTRHVTCADCHNSHSMTKAKAVAPFAPGAIAGVKGVTAAGAVTRNAQLEYELCFRCHADTIQRGASIVSRQSNETNKRLQFSTSNQSFHPVVAPGRNQNVPSLISPLKTSSMIYCTDCHNSDSSPRAGGQGADGPHGSRFAPLLERQLVTTDNTPESPANYALCYKCHSRSVILGDQVNSFKYHSLHVVQKQTACTTCHDSHGVATNAKLINFNTFYVSPNKGIMSFNDGAPGTRTCTLTCHGKAHDEKMPKY